MAKTFDVSDPDQYEDYLRESVAQMALYGNVYLRLEAGSGSKITIQDGADPPASYSQDGFMLAMDDGHIRPVPAPGGGT